MKKIIYNYYLLSFFSQSKNLGSVQSFWWRVLDPENTLIKGLVGEAINQVKARDGNLIARDERKELDARKEYYDGLKGRIYYLFLL